VVGLLDDALDPQAVIDRPRFCIDPPDNGSPVYLEEGLPEATVAALTAMGHSIVPGVSGLDRSRFGRGQVIRVEGEQLVGGTDHRADGVALALS
jgi:gamma-glutamyltranspeptidase/glutathione hydrolase